MDYKRRVKKNWDSILNRFRTIHWEVTMKDIPHNVGRLAWVMFNEELTKANTKISLILNMKKVND